MNVEQQIAKLKSLLDRIRRKGAEPRPASARAHVATSAASPVGTPAVHVSEAAPAELEELDMMDDEIVEIDTVLASPRAEAAEIDLDEPIPESAPRAARALADEADLEPPVKTPPPESGRQVMAPAPAGPTVTFHEEAEEVDLSGAGDVDALLEADHSGGPISKAPPGKPTMEQLGETVELEGADAPAAELELLMPAPEHEAEPDELEVSLPMRGFVGGYDSSLAPPSLSEPSSMPMSAMPPTELAPAPPAAPPVAPPVVPPVRAQPLVVERPPLRTLHAAEVIVGKPARLPETFLELLDASLRL